MSKKQKIDEYVDKLPGEIIAVSPFEVEDPPILMHPNPTDDELYGLAESIKHNGQINPIVVYRKGDHYGLICGYMRTQAARRFNIPVLTAKLVKVDEATAMGLLVEENLTRFPHNPISELEMVQHAKEKLGLSIKQISEKYGWSEAWIRQRLELLRLPSELLTYIGDGRLKLTVASKLLRLPTRDLQLRFGIDSAQRGYSAEQLEAIINTYLAEAEKLQRPLTEEEIKAVEEVPLQCCDFCGKMKPVVEFRTQSFCSDCVRHTIYLWEREKAEMKLLELQQERMGFMREKPQVQ